jgi:hypothetical protein
MASVGRLIYCVKCRKKRTVADYEHVDNRVVGTCPVCGTRVSAFVRGKRKGKKASKKGKGRRSKRRVKAKKRRGSARKVVGMVPVYSLPMRYFRPSW